MAIKSGETPFTKGNRWRFTAENQPRKVTIKKLSKTALELLSMPETSLLGIVQDSDSACLIASIAKMLVDGQSEQALEVVGKLKEIAYGAEKTEERLVDKGVE